MSKKRQRRPPGKIKGVRFWPSELRDIEAAIFRDKRETFSDFVRLATVLLAESRKGK